MLADQTPRPDLVRINLVREARSRIVAFLTNRDPGDEQDDRDEQEDA